MRKSVFRTLAIGAATTLAFAATTVNAQAATGYDRCPSGYFCIFSGLDGQGTIAYFQYGSNNLAQQGIDNAASSTWNRHAQAFALCDGYNKVGQLWDVFQGAKTNLAASVDNRASSVAIYAHGCD